MTNLVHHTLIIEPVAQRIGVAAEHLQVLSGGYQNIVIEDTVNQRVIRLSAEKRRDIQTLQAELEWVKHLKSHGNPVLVPISFQGELVNTIQYLDQNFHLSFFDKVEGHILDVEEENEWNESMFYSLGKILGQLHACSKSDIEQQRLWSRKVWIDQEHEHLNMADKLSTFNPMMGSNYLDLIHGLLQLPRNSEEFGLIHNDYFHHGNIMVNDQTKHIIDFDDCCYNWYVNDIAVAFYHATWHGRSVYPEWHTLQQDFLTHFLKGYRQSFTLSQYMLEQLPVFLKLRECFLFHLFQEKWDHSNLQEWQEHTLTQLYDRIIKGVVPFEI